MQLGLALVVMEPARTGKGHLCKVCHGAGELAGVEVRVDSVLTTACEIVEARPRFAGRRVVNEVVARPSAMGCRVK